MSMISKFCLPRGIVTGNATITAAGGTVSTDANYGLTSLYDGNPAKPCKFTTDSATLLFDFTSAQRLDAVAIPHHNIDAGVSVTIQGNATNSWGSPSLSVPLTIYPHDFDGHVQRAWVDLTTKTGYTVTGYRYWRLVIGTNSVAVQLGEVLLISILSQLERGAQGDIQIRINRKYVPAVETDAGVEWIYERDVKQAEIVGTIVGTLQDYEDVKELLDDAHGRSRGFFFVLDSEVEHYDGLYVRATQDMCDAFGASRPTEYLDGVVQFTWGVREISRGLPL